MIDRHEGLVRLFFGYNCLLGGHFSFKFHNFAVNLTPMNDARGKTCNLIE